MTNCFKIATANNRKMEKYLLSCQQELNNFFQITIAIPNVFLIKSRKQYDALQKRKTENWQVGFTQEKNIFILDPDVFTHESNHKNKKHFWDVLKHEYVHIAFSQATNGSGNPRWMSEGLACFLAGQSKPDLEKENALKVFQYFAAGGKHIYALGYFWVKLLIDKFGAEKMLALIRLIGPATTEKQFALHFHKIYGFRYSVKDFENFFS